MYRRRTPRRKIRDATPRLWEPLESRHLLAGDLVAHWRAEELTATVDNGATVAAWPDQIAGLSAVGRGSPTLRHGAIGGRAAIQFAPQDDVDQLVVERLSSPMSNALDFTVSVVFSTAAGSTHGSNGVWFENTAIVDASSLGFANDWGLSLNTAGQVGAGLGFGFGLTPVTVYSEVADLNDEAWHQATYRRSGKELSLTIDGQAMVQRDDGHANRLASLDLSIGSQKFGDLPFAGLIAELRVYNGALDDAQLASLSSQIDSYYNNQPPRAEADSYVLSEDPIFFFHGAATGVLANDRDAEGDPMRAELVTSPSHGQLTLREDGSFVYDPNTNFFGTDSFQYVAVNSQSSSPATVTLDVLPVRDGANGVADSYATQPLQTLSITADRGLLANDLNPDLAELQVRLDQDASVGRLQLDADGGFRYDPQGFAGVTSFTYRLDDGVALSAPVTVTLVVNTPPNAVDDAYSISEDALLSIAASAGILSNDFDVDGDSTQLTLVSSTQHGTLGFSADGSFLYAPSENYFGADTFSYRLNDGHDDSSVATVRLTVVAINDPPVTRSDEYVGLPDQSLSIPAQRGVLANDSDVDAPQLTAELVNSPQQGTISFQAIGSFEYQPRAGYVGNDSFTYRVFDGVVWSPATPVQLTVTPTPIVISEVMAINSKSLETRIWEPATQNFILKPISPDWIELHNQTSSTISLADLYLTDDPARPRQWAFPEQASIGPHEYLVVYASGYDLRDAALDQQGRWHTNFSLDGEGGYLALIHENGTVLSTLSGDYPAQRVDVSYAEWNGQWLYSSPASPGAANTVGVTGLTAMPSFSVPHGFYAAPVTIDITTETPGATLVYTTDGSVPTLTHGTVVPADSAQTAPVARVTLAATSMLRAAAFEATKLPSEIQTASYLFVADIRQQRVFTSTVVNSPIWGPQLEASLLALPTISLVTPGRISVTEIGTSVELIFPDGSAGFQIDAGVEHYGGHSLSSPKKNMRLTFKSQYGDGALKYDLFGDGAVDEFQELLLRTGSHDTFFWTHPDGGAGNYLRNRWAFDRQLEMGQLAPHGRFVQVYINGTYWGLHELMERPNADFMASYLGGESFNYDALNAGAAIDGDVTAWSTMRRNEVIDDYARLQQYLDLENYADYMLLQFYGGNDWDWNTEQNWMAARRREPGAGYIFFAWDSDVILRTTANANVISRGGPGQLWSILGGVKQHPEFLLMMADRAERYFFGDGMFSDERLRADISQMAEQIRLPMIAESARWGGAAYTPQTWENAVQWMLDRFAPNGAASRASTVIEQMRRARVYPSIDPPTFVLNSEPRTGQIRVGAADILTVSAAAGQVYYTLNGVDPRLPGGGLHESAILASGSPWQLDQAVRVKARALHNGEWSTLREVTLEFATVDANAQNVSITEVHYHPSPPTDAEQLAGIRDADEFEFIEIKNVSGSTVSLANLQFVQQQIDGQTSGIAFDFADGQIPYLAPGGRAVVVENQSAFALRYGADLPVAGEWVGGLGNRSEMILLQQVDGQVVRSFSYQDRWLPSTDGNGFSLQLIDEAQADAALGQFATDWRASETREGSPGTADQIIVPGDANRDGRFDSSDLVLIFIAGEYEDTVLGNSTWEDGDWDADGDFTTRDLVFAFTHGNYVAAAQRADHRRTIKRFE